MEEEKKINQEEISPVEQIFRVLDKNNDGFIDESDLSEVIKELKLKITEERLKKDFSAFKGQNSQAASKEAVKVSLNEFKYWWNHMRESNTLEFISYLQARAYGLASSLQTMDIFNRSGSPAPSEYESDVSSGLLRIATGSLRESYATSIKLEMNLQTKEGATKHPELLKNLGLNPEDNCLLLVKLKLSEDGKKDPAAAQSAFQALMKSIVVVAQSLNKTAKEVLKLLNLTYKVHEDLAYIIVKPAESIKKNIVELYNICEKHLSHFQSEEGVRAELAFSVGPLEILEKLINNPHEAIKALLGCCKLELKGYIRKIFRHVFQELNNSLNGSDPEESQGILGDSLLLSIMIQSLKADILLEDPSEYLLQKEEFQMPLLQISGAVQNGNKLKLPSMPILKKSHDFFDKYLEGGLGIQVILECLSASFDVKLTGFLKVLMNFCSF